jgi:mono/diheme cytochrome c family protein
MRSEAVQVRLKNPPLKFSRLLFASALVFASACSDDAGDTGDAGDDIDTGTSADTDTGTAGDGREYYDGEASAALGADGNQVRCSTCHSDDGTLAGHSGKSMKDIAFKDSYKGGGSPDLLSATNACVTGWMGGTALADTDPEYIALAGFLESISDPSSTTPNAIAPEVLTDEAEYEANYAGGDAAAGAAKYDANCAICHDNALVLGSFPAYPKAALANYSNGRIAQKVRTSGPPPSGTADGTDSTPGPMPFFEPEELPPADLADIIAHLKG